MERNYVTVTLCITYAYAIRIGLRFRVRCVQFCLQSFDAVGWAAGRASGL